MADRWRDVAPSGRHRQRGGGGIEGRDLAGDQGRNRRQCAEPGLERGRWLPRVSDDLGAERLQVGVEHPSHAIRRRPRIVAGQRNPRRRIARLQIRDRARQVAVGGNREQIDVGRQLRRVDLQADAGLAEPRAAERNADRRATGSRVRCRDPHRECHERRVFGAGDDLENRRGVLESREYRAEPRAPRGDLLGGGRYADGEPDRDAPRAVQRQALLQYAVVGTGRHDHPHRDRHRQRSAGQQNGGSLPCERVFDGNPRQHRSAVLRRHD